MDVATEKLKTSATGTSPVDCNLKEYVNKINLFFPETSRHVHANVITPFISDRRIY